MHSVQHRIAIFNSTANGPEHPVHDPLRRRSLQTPILDALLLHQRLQQNLVELLVALLMREVSSPVHNLHVELLTIIGGLDDALQLDKLVSISGDQHHRDLYRLGVLRHLDEQQIPEVVQRTGPVFLAAKRVLVRLEISVVGRQVFVVFTDDLDVFAQGVHLGEVGQLDEVEPAVIRGGVEAASVDVGVGARHRHQFVHQLGELVGQAPAEEAADVVAHDGATGHSQRDYQLLQFFQDHVDPVGFTRGGLVGVAEAFQVEGYDAEVLGQDGDLVPPAEPAVGEAVEEEHQGQVARTALDVVELHTLKNYSIK